MSHYPAMALAFVRTGHLHPFFGTLLGWLGVALTGSDTSSNVLFGSLQKISAQQVGVSPIMMASANSCGGVIPKYLPRRRATSALMVRCSRTIS